MENQGRLYHLGGVILQNLPDFSPDMARALAENPMGVQKILRRAFCRPQNSVGEEKSILQRTFAPVALTGTEKFVAADHFRLDNEAGVRFRGFSASFGENLLSKVETNVPPGTLIIHELLNRFSMDVEIIAELGGWYETKLYYLWQMLKKQPSGFEKEARLGLGSSQASVFYIRNTKGVLGVVSVDWNNNGWYLLYSNKKGCSNVARVFSL